MDRALMCEPAGHGLETQLCLYLWDFFWGAGGEGNHHLGICSKCVTLNAEATETIDSLWFDNLHWDSKIIHISLVHYFVLFIINFVLETPGQSML